LGLIGGSPILVYVDIACCCHEKIVHHALIGTLKNILSSCLKRIVDTSFFENLELEAKF
jgi:hypothetical protein